MTKADIVSDICQRTGIDKQIVIASIDAFMQCIKESVAREENVYLRGFGSFVLKMRAQKTARNISKNTTIIIPAHNVTIFRPAKGFDLNAKEANEEK